MAKTFPPLRVGSEETYTIDLFALGWLAPGDQVDTGASVFATDESGIQIIGQNWSDNDRKNNVRVKAVDVNEQPGYHMTVRLKTNLRDITEDIYIRTYAAP